MISLLVYMRLGITSCDGLESRRYLTYLPAPTGCPLWLCRRPHPRTEWSHRVRHLVGGRAPPTRGGAVTKKFHSGKAKQHRRDGDNFFCPNSSGRKGKYYVETPWPDESRTHILYIHINISAGKQRNPAGVAGNKASSWPHPFRYEPQKQLAVW